MGNHGLLGLLGKDGQFRAWRIGDTVLAGSFADYRSFVPESDIFETLVELTDNHGDGVARYTSARELYDFPLAVIAGLSFEEQMANVNAQAATYRWRAAIINAFLLLVIGLLWWLSHKIADIRKREVEAEIAYAKQVEYLAYHDTLTGLPNRSLFSKLLDQSIKQARRSEEKLAVMFLDLDHFKYINDTLGHDAGDQLLQDVSSRLKSCLRDSDIVARLGGDEFVVVLPSVTDEVYTSSVAKKMISAVSKSYILFDQECRVTVSIGISIYPADGLDEQTLTKNADIAMYQAKEEGKNTFQYYSQELHSQSLERLTLESSLRLALKNEQFSLHYQAKWDISANRITGMEALLRWEHPELGVIAPLRFLPLAEEMGLIVPLEKWVIKTACRQNVAWQKKGLPKVSVAINLSAHQFFDPELPEYIASVLRETEMDANLLELEITESILLSRGERVVQVLNSLKEIGVRIAIDDFGVGYSSLSMLKQFPLDVIKIDRNFVRDMSTTNVDRELTQAMVAMGRKLSLTVVAQGVETKDQADFLRDNVCDQLQGFYFNKPVAAEEFTELFSRSIST